uniref:Calpain catalytic domain-containing protein n=1 Tax=Varanus komodoensis TaxID=61221 RepID=A0A8D2LVS6_VARKO
DLSSPNAISPSLHHRRRRNQESWHIRRKGPIQKHSRLSEQNYYALLEQCLKKGCLFEDPLFPADVRSIGTGPILQKLPQKIHWKRPYVSDGIRRLALCQGLIEDCWFLAAVEALTFHQDILFKVVPQNQSFERKKYAGIFHFKVGLNFKWINLIYIDPYGEI